MQYYYSLKELFDPSDHSNVQICCPRYIIIIDAAKGCAA